MCVYVQSNAAICVYVYNTCYAVSRPYLQSVLPTMQVLQTDIWDVVYCLPTVKTPVSCMYNVKCTIWYAWQIFCICKQLKWVMLWHPQICKYHESVQFCKPDLKTCAVKQKPQIEPDNCMVLTPTWNEFVWLMYMYVLMLWHSQLKSFINLKCWRYARKLLQYSVTLKCLFACIQEHEQEMRTRKVLQNETKLNPGETEVTQ